MNNFIFESCTKVFFGAGCVKEYLSCLMGRYGDTVMLVDGGPPSKRDGIYGEVVQILQGAGKRIVGFSRSGMGPTCEEVAKGARLAREEQVDVILGVGDGPVIDCCKAVSIAAVSEEDLWEHFWARAGVVTFDPLPLGVIVTAVASGGECNGSTSIINDVRKTKISRDYPRCDPRFALMDPTYTYGVPAGQMVSGGFATLSHIMAAYFSGPDTDELSDDIAQALMKRVIKALRALAGDPEDHRARSDLMWLSAMAGNRIVKLGKKGDLQCWQMGCQLGAYTGCDQGGILAVLQPAYHRHIYPYGLEKFIRSAREVWEISADGKTGEELALAGVEALAGFIREIGLPSTLSQLGIDDEAMLEQVADRCIVSNDGYKKMSHEEILEIFKECL